MLWATDNLGGEPARIVHVDGGRFDGAPTRLACGRTTHGLYLFVRLELDGVPPWIRCGVCADAAGHP